MELAENVLLVAWVASLVAGIVSVVGATVWRIRDARRGTARNGEGTA